MTTFWLTFTLKSDATFGRGEGVAGLVDEEVEHDRYGLPYLRGRTLKGLLVEECANILYSLSQQLPDEYDKWQGIADRLFGAPGAYTQDTGIMQVSDACLPTDLRQTVQYHHEENNLSREDVLESLTDIRRQTAVDEETARPQDGSLRAMRVILRETLFEAPLQFSQPPEATDLALLSASVLAFRRAGTGRNRGRGHLTARLLDINRQDVTATYFKVFQEAVNR